MTMRHRARCALVLIIVLALSAGVAGDAGAQLALAAPRAAAPTTPLLDVDGVRVTTLSVAGGEMAADIVSNDLGPDGWQKKHVANTRWTPFTVRVDPSTMGRGMFDWVQATLEQPHSLKNGVVTMPGTEKNPAGTALTYLSALLTRIAFTGLDAAKPACRLDVTFEAEQVRMAAGSATAAVPIDRMATSPCAGFRVQLTGLDNAVAAIVRIDSIVVTQAVAADQVGIFREPTKHPVKVNIPNVTLTLPEAKSQEVWDWAKQWFVDGARQEADERTMNVVLRNALGRDFVTLQGSGVGLAGVRAITDASGQRMMQVELYVEHWRLAPAT